MALCLFLSYTVIYNKLSTLQNAHRHDFIMCMTVGYFEFEKERAARKGAETREGESVCLRGSFEKYQEVGSVQVGGLALGPLFVWDKNQNGGIGLEQKGHGGKQQSDNLC